MNRPASPRPPSVSARPRRKDALAYVFKTVHLQHGGKLSLTRLLAGHLDDGATLQSSSGETGRVSGILGGQRRPRHQARLRPRPATWSRSASSTPSRPATRCRAARPRRRRWCSVEPSPPVLAMALAADRPQGRRQARPGAVAAERGRPFADHDPQPANPRHRAVGAGRDASAGGAGAAARSLRRQRQVACAGDRLSGDHPQADHPARPAQEAIRRPRPVRRRGAGDQADAARRRLRVSTRRWSAARCRATISARWKRAWSMD